MPQIDPVPIQNPANYLTQQVVALANTEGLGAPVSRSNPLPVTAAVTVADSVPLSGSTSAALIAGPFTPALGRTIWLQLSGNWTGTVQLKRSVDGGTTLLPLTVAGDVWARFTGNANEPVGEESVAAARYYLDIALASGTLAYRVEQ